MAGVVVAVITIMGDTATGVAMVTAVATDTDQWSLLHGLSWPRGPSSWHPQRMVTVTHRATQSVAVTMGSGLRSMVTGRRTVLESAIQARDLESMLVGSLTRTVSNIGTIAPLKF